MLTHEQLMNFKTAQETTDEIEKRYKLIDLCVGQLYPSILDTEIGQLYSRGLDLMKEEMKCLSK